MDQDFAECFSTKDGQREFGGYIKQLIRSGQHAHALSELRQSIARYPSPITEAAAAVEPDDIIISGWDRMNARLVELDGRGIQTTAIRAHISNYADLARTPEGWVEPSIEVSCFTDEEYPFSTASREDLLARNLDYPTPWEGSGADADFPLELTGLARLNAAIINHPLQQWPYGVPQGESTRAPDDMVAFFLSEWLIHALFHNAMKQMLDRNGLVRPMPMLVGTHGVGPFVQSVYITDKIFDHGGKAEKKPPHPGGVRADEYDRDTERAIADLSVRRETINMLDRPEEARLRSTMAKGYQMEETMILRRFGLEALSRRRSCLDMSDAEFDDFIATLRHARNPDVPVPPVPSPPSPPQNRGGFATRLFGRKRS